MATRHYRKNLKSSIVSKSYIYVTPTIVTPSTSSSNSNSNNITISFEFDKVQKLILNIIDMISTKMEINEIIIQTNAILNTLDPSIQMYDLLDNLQDTIFSIIHNITNFVDIRIINTRITYLYQLISELPCNIPSTYVDVGNLIIELLTFITNNIDIDLINKQFDAINNIINNDVTYTNQMTTVYETIISIVQNIIDRVDISIIKRRISYLQELIMQLNC